MSMIRRRLRFLVVGRYLSREHRPWLVYVASTKGLRYALLWRFLGRDPRRWLPYVAATRILRGIRTMTRGEPEVVYRAALGPGHRLDLLTDRPLPRRFRSRQLRRALADKARAELGG